MGIVALCENGREHEGRFFHVGLEVREIGKAHRERQREFISLGHFCEDCLRKPDAIKIAGRPRRVLQPGRSAGR